MSTVTMCRGFLYRKLRQVGMGISWKNHFEQGHVFGLFFFSCCRLKHLFKVESEWSLGRPENMLDKLVEVPP